MTNCCKKEKIHKTLSLRLLDGSATDSMRILSEFLSLVYKDRAEQGIDYLPDGQDEETTFRRVADRESWVAEADGKIIATFTLSLPGKAHGTWWYRQGAIAEFNQLAVHPDFQTFAMFKFLCDAVERRAIELGALESAGSVPTQRKRLLNAYLHRGYRIVDYKWKKNAKYGSYVFSKMLAGNGIPCPWYRRVLRKIKYFRRFIRYGLRERK